VYGFRRNSLITLYRNCQLGAAQADDADRRLNLNGAWRKLRNLARNVRNHTPGEFEQKPELTGGRLVLETVNIQFRVGAKGHARAVLKDDAQTPVGCSLQGIVSEQVRALLSGNRLRPPMKGGPTANDFDASDYRSGFLSPQQRRRQQ